MIVAGVGQDDLVIEEFGGSTPLPLPLVVCYLGELPVATDIAAYNA
ncbi:hypothetical protein [Streptomyces sp. NPDC003480]